MMNTKNMDSGGGRLLFFGILTLSMFDGDIRGKFKPYFAKEHTQRKQGKFPGGGM